MAVFILKRNLFCKTCRNFAAKKEIHSACHTCSKSHGILPPSDWLLKAMNALHFNFLPPSMQRPNLPFPIFACDFSRTPSDLFCSKINLLEHKNLTCCSLRLVICAVRLCNFFWRSGFCERKISVFENISPKLRQGKTIETQHTETF